MTVNLSALAGAGQQFFTDTGSVLTGGKLYSYAAGTTTPQTTYTSALGSTAHTNPIVLDSAGRVPGGEIWLTAGSNYKFVLKTSTDATLATWDNITGINGTGIASNASNVQYDPAGTGAVSTTVQAKLRESVSVKDFGAVGDGSANDTTAFLNAIASGAGCINVPDGTYKITSKLTLGIGQTLMGTNFDKVSLVHTFSGDMLEMLEKSQAFNITFTGQGSSYTGKGLVMTGTNGRQYVENCSFLDFEDAAIYFNLAAGSQSCFNNVRGTRTGATYPSTKYCVVVDDSAFYNPAAPRTFINYMSSGFTAFDFGSCNNFYVLGGYIGDCKFNDNSRAVTMSGVRVAYLGTFDIKGGNHAFSSCAFGGSAPQTIITSGGAITIEGCTFNQPPILDSSTSGGNQISCVAVAYTPTLTGNGTAPSLGNGSIIATAQRSGSLVTVEVELTVGSTTDLGSGILYISLPTFYPNRGTVTCANGSILLNNVLVYYPGVTLIETGTIYTQYVSLFTGSSFVTKTVPATWTTGDLFRIQFSYTS